MAVLREMSISTMEPLLISSDNKARGQLVDLALDLASKSTGLLRSLPIGVAEALSELVRSMNCYYSNLIEGHDTHPIDIERALKADYLTDPIKRELQLEAKAHIEVQKWLDQSGLKSKAASISSITLIHQKFCEALPDSLLWNEDPTTKERVAIQPGEFRLRNVKVGSLIPVSPEAIQEYLLRYETVYGGLSKTESLIATAAAHHRLLWIHPFLDGNGRVARLMSHAMLQEVLQTGSLWSIARGLARTSVAYKAHLANCDQQRRNELDGRGNLSQEALIEFTQYFLKLCIDQINFMETLIQPETLRGRIHKWAKEEMTKGHLPPKANLILDGILYRGELSKSEVPTLTGTGERQARRIVSELLTSGAIKSTSVRAPLTLNFSAALAGKWLPGLFPDKN